MKVNVDPKSTKWFDVREYPDFNDRFTTWFSKKVVTSSGFRSDYWRNKTMFGAAASMLFRCFVDESGLKHLKELRAKAVEKRLYTHPATMPKDANEAIRKIVTNEDLFSQALKFAEEVQNIIRSKNSKKTTVAATTEKPKTMTKKLF